jgi:prepilin-type N-terminal cleavage/methylation domain-containing protein
MESRHHGKGNPGFTLMELLTAIVIITILLVMLFPALQGVQSRMEKVRCMSNLRGLYGACSVYIQQHGHWPQIDPNLIGTDKKAYTEAWIAALQPMGIAPKNWICPTVQRSSNDPDYTQENSIRIDYIATPFDDKNYTPYRWPSQPWFVENNDAHGSGNLIIFTDGSIRDLNDVKKSPPRSSN